MIIVLLTSNDPEHHATILVITSQALWAKVTLVVGHFAHIGTEPSRRAAPKRQSPARAYREERRAGISLDPVRPDPAVLEGLFIPNCRRARLSGCLGRTTRVPGFGQRGSRAPRLLYFAAVLQLVSTAPAWKIGWVTCWSSKQVTTRAEAGSADRE